MARCLSAVIRFHNKQYRPKNGGVCVANHTSPVDVLVLSTDNSYSLVSYIMWMWKQLLSTLLCFFLFVLSLLFMWGVCLLGTGDVVDFMYSPGGLYTRWWVQAKGEQICLDYVFWSVVQCVVLCYNVP